MRLRQRRSSSLGDAVLLLRAPGFVRDGHLEEPGLEQWGNDLVPELGPVRASRWRHQLRQRPGFSWIRLFRALSETTGTEATFSSFGVSYSDFEAEFTRVP